MHDVDHEITIVEQHPLAFGQAFAGTRLTLAAFEIQVLFDLFGNRQHLTFVRSGGDEHRVGNGQWFGDVEGNKVGGLSYGRPRRRPMRMASMDLVLPAYSALPFGLPASTTCCVFSE